VGVVPDDDLSGMCSMRILLSVMAATLVVFGAARAPADDAASHWVLQEPPAIYWRAADTLPPGAQIAVLEGYPTQEGYFTMRIKMPDGYRVPPHWHPKQERVTVLSGVLNLGTGDMFDAKKTKALQPGTYSSMPPRRRRPISPYDGASTRWPSPRTSVIPIR